EERHLGLACRFLVGLLLALARGRGLGRLVGAASLFLRVREPRAQAALVLAAPGQVLLQRRDPRLQLFRLPGQLGPPPLRLVDLLPTVAAAALVAVDRQR